MEGNNSPSFFPLFLLTNLKKAIGEKGSLLLSECSTTHTEDYCYMEEIVSENRNVILKKDPFPQVKMAIKRTEFLEVIGCPLGGP